MLSHRSAPWPDSSRQEKSDLLENIIVDSKSGVSGAGRDVVLDSLFCEVNEGVKAYKIFEHRHTPEIEQELSQVAGRGCLSPLFLTSSPWTGDPQHPLRHTHEDDEDRGGSGPLCRNLPGRAFCSDLSEGKASNTRSVKGSNYCDIGVVSGGDGRMVIVTGH